MRPGIDLFATSLSVVLIGFSTAGLLLDTAYVNNPKMEAALCRFYVCDTTALAHRANVALLDLGAAATNQATEAFRDALRRDLAYPYRWCDLGQALMISGKTDAARYCYSRAVTLAPNSPLILIRAANFELLTNRPQNAFRFTSTILHLVPDYDQVIFLSYARAAFSPEQILSEGLPDESPAVTSYFEYLLSKGTTASAATVWDRMRSRKFVNERLAALYIQFLLHQGSYQDAMNQWAGYLGPRRGPYPNSNLLFNGEFENELTGSPFDWTLARFEHVDEQRVSLAPYSGNWSLRIVFDGKANVDYRGAIQTAVVSPGRYHFTAAVRTEALTTNQGIGFRLVDPESPARLNLRTGIFTGTTAWTTLTYDFTVGAGTKLIAIQPVRQPSEKFDNKIAGSAWIDSVTLAPIGARTVF